MKLNNLLIKELYNCSLGAIVESCAMPKHVNLISFLQNLISKEHTVVIMEFPDWVQHWLSSQTKFEAIISKDVGGDRFQVKTHAS